VIGGVSSRDVDDAYNRYIGFLSGMHESQRLGPPAPPLQKAIIRPGCPRPTTQS
jgi:hypothetical protein